MIDALVFPDTRSALFDLINGATHRGEGVRAFYHLPADAYGQLQGPFPVAHIYVTGGTEGYIDRVDRATVDVYAPGEQAVNVLESIRASICGVNIETPSGFLDRIDPDVTPADVPYQSDTLNRATATFLVTSRPL
ncbi:tail terminator [Arthrobacter phage Bauer]|uniref:Tail terminator n=1 Tax=Arthrobacter phage Bauer TaxID=2985648 RepID=A0A9E7V2J7_9CAUD|nr:tail terminator [Arthrobacter phage Bauer]UUG69973.1 tail terminator [Arthrobacter phage Zucker]UYM26563.1 tail terminator [Arthrobacter phage Bauer]